MPIIVIPFNHARLRDLLMMEWGEFRSFEDYRQPSGKLN